MSASASQNYDNIPFPVLLLSPEGRILSANAAMLESVGGLPLEEIAGKRCRDVLCAGCPRPEWCPFREGVASHDVTNKLFSHTPSGRTFLVSIKRVFDASGNLDHLLETAIDVTDRHEMAENDHAFERALHELECDEMLRHPLPLLKIIRERLDADFCYLVDNLKTEICTQVLPGFVAFRDGRTNDKVWKLDPEATRRIDERKVRDVEVSRYSSDEVEMVKRLYAGTEAEAHFRGVRSLYTHNLFRKDKLVGVLCVAYTTERRLNPYQEDFLHRGAHVLVTALDRVLTTDALRFSNESLAFKDDIVGYIFRNWDFAAVRNYIAERLLALTGGQHLTLTSQKGERADWCTVKAHARCRRCAEFHEQDHLPDEVFALGDVKIIEHVQVEPADGVAIPEGCPAIAKVFRQLRRVDGWWRVVMDFTEAPKRPLEAVSNLIGLALDLLSIAYDREKQAQTIERQLDESRQMTQKIVAERDRVVETEKAKSLFFSSVSHDIRTPLNAIIGLSELLKAGAVPSHEIQQNLDLIEASGKTLLHLVDDLMDLSQLEAGKMVIQPEPTDCDRLVRDIVPIFEPMAEKQGQVIVSSVGRMPTLMLDPFRLRQIVFNLVGNAIKYAGPCTIRVTASYVGGPRSPWRMMATASRPRRRRCSCSPMRRLGSGTGRRARGSASPSAGSSPNGWAARSPSRPRKGRAAHSRSRCPRWRL